MPRTSTTSLFSSSTEEAQKIASVADELGLPCEGECALPSYPNLPESVHPGVLSGKAMMDLLNHAKENGTLQVVTTRAELLASFGGFPCETLRWVF